MKKTIDAKTKDGAFVFHDPKLDADLNLLFDQIKIVRGMTGYGWFANVIFHDKDEPKKQCAIDFWFKPDGSDLKLMDIRVQKGPKQEGDGYVMITRSPVAWWWLPVSEHPGDAEITRGWQVMGAIHDYIATHRDSDGHLDIKDHKTGEALPLDFVEIHQPVRHLKKDGDFVCTDFRKPGSKDEYYDIDFWVNQRRASSKSTTSRSTRSRCRRTASGPRSRATPSRGWISTKPTRRPVGLQGRR